MSDPKHKIPSRRSTRVLWFAVLLTIGIPAWTIMFFLLWSITPIGAEFFESFANDFEAPSGAELTTETTFAASWLIGLILTMAVATLAPVMLVLRAPSPISDPKLTDRVLLACAATAAAVLLTALAGGWIESLIAM